MARRKGTTKSTSSSGSQAAALKKKEPLNKNSNVKPNPKTRISSKAKNSKELDIQASDQQGELSEQDSLIMKKTGLDQVQNMKQKSRNTTPTTSRRHKKMDDNDAETDNKPDDLDEVNGKPRIEEELRASEVGTRRTGRSAKKQALKKMADLKDESQITDDEDDDDPNNMEFEDCGDSDDDDDDDDDVGSDDSDFEVSPPLKTSAKRRKGKERVKKDSSDTRSTPIPKVKEDNSVKPVKIVERYSSSQASKEAFLSLSESDSSSDEDDESSKPRTAEDSGAARKNMKNLKPKSIFDDLAPSSPLSLRKDEPSESLQTFKMDTDDFGEIGNTEVETQVPSTENEFVIKQELPSAIYSPYFATPTSSSVQPKAVENGSLSDMSEGSNDEREEDLEKRPSTTSAQEKHVKRKKSTKVKGTVKMEVNEEFEKETKHKSAPHTSRKRGRVPSIVDKEEQNDTRMKSKTKIGGRKTQKEQDSKQSPAKRRKMVLKVEKLNVTKVEGAGKKRGRGQKAGSKVGRGHAVVKEEARGGDDVEMSSDDSHSDWEEVEDTPMNEIGEPTIAPEQENKPEQKSLQIDIALPDTSKKANKKKKMENLWAQYFQWQVNKHNKEKQLQFHKVHLVLLLANCFHSNNLCNKAELQCIGLSIVPPDIVAQSQKSLGIFCVTKLIKWFKGCVELISDLNEDMTSSLDRVLPSRFENKEASSPRELVHMFAIILRALGAETRLIFSLQPVTHKAKLLTKRFKQENASAEVKKRASKSPVQPPQALTPENSSTPATKQSSYPKTSSSGTKSVSSRSNTPTSSKLKDSEKTSKQSSYRKTSSADTKSVSNRTNTPSSSTVKESKKTAKQSSYPKTSSASNKSVSSQSKTPTSSSIKESTKSKSGQTPKSSRTTSASKNVKTVKPDVVTKETGGKKEGRGVRKQVEKGVGGKAGDSKTSINEVATPRRVTRTKNQSRRKVASKVTSRDDDDDDDNYEEMESSDDDHSDYEMELKKFASKRKSRTQSSRTSKKKLNSSASTTEEVVSDSDFEIQVLSVTKQQVKKDGKPKKVSRKILSSDSEESVVEVNTKSPRKKGRDCWVEIYLKSERRWICVDCVGGHVGKVQMCEQMATSPITYIIGVEADGHMKDLTRRYASKWLTETHKLRPDEEWWEETLRPYLGNKERDRKENSALKNNLLDRPLPTSIGEYKNHPLYALKRHLLKFEALYPECPAVLGYCRGEAVYARECVRTLHTRETWLKEAKAIRIGELPYKMVKPRPKWKKGVGMIKTDESTLGVFGAWQVEDYIAPPAVDGRVPRNEHGNVELFKPSMLPAGTVHLQIPGLNKVARKLDIDCVPAMTGWDFHQGFNHPVMDGFVVCEEYVEVLVASWEEEKAVQEKKEKEKREARAMKNWKLIIKSLLIRERLKVRYQTHNDCSLRSAGTSQGAGKGEKVDIAPVKAHWPENKMTAFTGDSANLLPFEKKAKAKAKGKRK